MALTDIQKAFCREYVKVHNATQAAISAGYSKKSASDIAYQLKNQPEIQDYLKKLMANVYKRNHMEINEAISILADIARANIGDFINEDGTVKQIHEMPRHALNAIEEVEFTTVWEVETYQEPDLDTGEMINRTVKRPVQVPKKYKASGKRDAIDKLLRYLGGYEKDNEQQNAPTILQLNPLDGPAPTLEQLKNDDLM